METIALIPTKFCIAVKTTKCGWSSNVENKSNLADCRHLEKLLDRFYDIWQYDASETSATCRRLRFPEFENSSWMPATILKNRNITMSP